MTEKMTAEQMFDTLEELMIASEDFIKGAICCGGYNEETAERILFYQTGYRTFEQMFEYEFEEEEEE